MSTYRVLVYGNVRIQRGTTFCKNYFEEVRHKRRKENRRILKWLFIAISFLK